MKSGRRGRRPVDHLEGDVRFHHPLPGVRVMEARDCSHRWVVFHETYSFCYMLRFTDPVVVTWRYTHRSYEADDRHPVMAMQPGELHADLERTPPADFIVVQIAPQDMARVAKELGHRTALPNIRHPHPASQDPVFIEALSAFAEARCDTLFSQGQCSCSAQAGLHRANLVRIVAAFVQRCAEDARVISVPDRGAAVVRKAREHLADNFSTPFDAEEVAKACGCGVYYLDHVFAGAMGVSPVRYHQEILVARTASLLLRSPRGGRSIEAIAADAGWPGAALGREQARLVHKRIRQTWGVTPNELRPPPLS